MRRDEIVPRLVVAALVIGVVVVLLIEGGSGGGNPPPVPSTLGPPPTTGTSTSPSPAPAPGRVQFGANVNRLFNDRTYSPVQIDDQLAALSATGATLARSDAFWEASEPSPPAGGHRQYDWTFDDLIAGSLAEHGLRWLPIVDYSAPWAQSIPGQDHSPPKNIADYAAYAGALAARYGQGGTFWRQHPELQAVPVQAYEIWNEPDNAAFWSPSPDPARYAQLYEAAAGDIDGVDPNAIVLVGGLTRPATFLPAMLAADPQLHVEGVAIHPYGQTPDAVLSNVADARHAISRLGLGSVPLYVTEFGWATRPPGALDGAPERLRPGYLRDTLARLGASGCGVDAALVYTWVTPEINPRDHEDWFGISPPAGGSSPDVQAFSAGIRAGLAAAPASSC
jgi:hypothetical protein